MYGYDGRDLGVQQAIEGGFHAQTEALTGFSTNVPWNPDVMNAAFANGEGIRITSVNGHTFGFRLLALVTGPRVEAHLTAGPGGEFEEGKCLPYSLVKDERDYIVAKPAN